MSQQWRVEYIRYRSPDFSGRYYATDRLDAERAAAKLEKLKHISEVRIVLAEDASRENEG